MLPLERYFESAVAPIAEGYTGDIDKRGRSEKNEGTAGR
jgi:hypothetical protein